jgi:hypothetical protein
VNVLTPHERRENGRVIACVDAEGHFLASVRILKGVNMNQEFVDGLPSGSKVYVISKPSVLFLKWFRKYFIPRKHRGNSSLFLGAIHLTAMHLGCWSWQAHTLSPLFASKGTQPRLFTHWTCLPSSPLRRTTIKR